MPNSPCSNLQELEFLRSLTERELCELALLPLLSAQGYSEIRYTHGKLEGGKDIVFCSADPLAGKMLYCATVKRAPLTGAVTGSRAIREVLYQVKQALTQPYLNPFDAKEAFPERVYVITPHEITNEATESIKGELRDLSNHVFFIDGPLLLSMIDRDLPDLLASLADSELRYLHQLAGRARELAHVLPIPGQPKLSLTDLYTGGRLNIIPKESARLGSFCSPLNFSTASPPEADLSDTLREHNYLAIISDAGAGKTTCLKRITLDLIDRKRHAFEAQLLPVLVPLHRLPLSSFDSAQTFLETLESFLQIEYGVRDLDLKNPAGYALLLDGFDEVSDRHDALRRVINELSTLFPRVVVTSRPSRVPDLTDSFAYSSLEQFSDNDIRTFLVKWFSSRIAEVDAIMAHIRSDHHLYTFCRNPLLLTMYAALASRKSVGSLPTRRTDIYSQIVTLLVDEWDRTRGLVSNFDADEKRFALECVAFTLHQSGQKTFDRTLFESTVGGFLEAKGRVGSANSPLDEIIYRSSLIKRLPRSDSFEFTHLSFQEFFAAQWAQRTLGKADVQRLIFDEWWRTSVRFYCGLTRTLDGIVPKRKAISRGKIMWLGEYLVEADYTSAKTKGVVLDLVAEELAFSAAVEDREIQYAAQFGDQLVSRMVKRINLINQNLGTSEHPTNKSSVINRLNFLRLLVAVDSQLARDCADEMRTQKASFGSPTQTFACLVALAPKVRIAVWADWAVHMLQGLHGSDKSTHGVSQLKVMASLLDDNLARGRVDITTNRVKRVQVAARQVLAKLGR